MWAWRTSDLCTLERAVVYDFAKSRAGEHARRKFFEAHKLNRSEIAKLALDWIGKLYEIEREVQALDDPQRLAIRQARSKPHLQEFKTWLMSQRMQLVNADITAKAIDYALKRRGALIVHVNDARVPVDNNAVENMMRPVGLGRKSRPNSTATMPGLTSKMC